MSNAAIVNAIHKEGRRKMAVEDRQELVEKLEALKDQLKTAENPREGSQPKPELLQNVPEIKRQIAKISEDLTKDDDLVAKGDARKLLDNRRKEIEAIIKKEMPSEREQKTTVRANGQGDFERAVNKTVNHQKKYGDLIAEWQEIMRRLEPEDPEACRVSKLL